jgi:hypothetical protein
MEVNFMPQLLYPWIPFDRRLDKPRASLDKVTKKKSLPGIETFLSRHNQPLY